MPATAIFQPLLTSVTYSLLPFHLYSFKNQTHAKTNSLISWVAPALRPIQMSPKMPAEPRTWSNASNYLSMPVGLNWRNILPRYRRKINILDASPLTAAPSPRWWNFEMILLGENKIISAFLSDNRSFRLF